MRKASRPTFLHAAKAILVHPSAWEVCVLRSSLTSGSLTMGAQSCIAPVQHLESILDSNLLLWAIILTS